MPDSFNQSTLEMSTTPVLPSGSGQLWGDIAVNRIAVVVALVLLVILLADILRLFPSLLRCIPRWKGNNDIEHSVSSARTRNSIAWVMGLAFCLLADRYQLIAPSFKALVPEVWRFPLTAALFGATILIRRLAYLVSKFRNTTSEFSSTLQHCLYNYLILLVSLMMLSGVVLSVFKASDATFRGVFLVECAFFYLLHLVRISQIFSCRCGSLATILYLCGLEILPFGILTFTCTR